MPVAIKDLIDVAGVPTRCGSAVLADAPPAGEDAAVMARLAAEGIDVLLVPTTPVRATPIGAQRVDAPDGTQVEVLPALLSLTLPFNLLGWPAVSVPAPQTTGLPAGISWPQCVAAS